MTKEELEKTNDYELLMLYREDDEQAKNLLYYKYKFIIDILIHKYRPGLVSLNIDYQEIYSECSVGFSDALKNYHDNKEASLPTFITLCVERKLKGILRKYNRDKYKEINDTYSLDFAYRESDNNLIDTISDECEHDPFKNSIDAENYTDLLNAIKENLTKREYDVFILMENDLNYLEIAKILNKTPKQIDNAMQRIKTKVRNILEEIKVNS